MVNLPLNCRPEEEFVQGPEPDNPVTSTKSTCNYKVLGSAMMTWVQKNNRLISQMTMKELAAKRKRTRYILKYKVVKRWVSSAG
jgi:hypothetical protein